jgi:GNAT superfamily N-acetyltransferase
MTEALTQDAIIRRELRPGDAEGIIDLHHRVYSSEYGHNRRSREDVERTMARALANGWPENGGAVWLIERDGELAGSLALTREDEDTGAVHWFVLLPELRGRGLGRSMLAELLAEARANRFSRLELETFSLLRTAASLYREVGFRVVSQWDSDIWGPLLTFQRYELQLR